MPAPPDLFQETFKAAVVELLAALDMTAGGLSTDCDHWDRQRRAEEAVRRYYIERHRLSDDTTKG